MSEAVTVELRMIEQVFRLATTVEKKPDLEKAAELLNEKFQEFRRNAPRVEHNKLVIIGGIRINARSLGSQQISARIYTL